MMKKAIGLLLAVVSLPCQAQMRAPDDCGRLAQIVESGVVSQAFGRVNTRQPVELGVSTCRNTAETVSRAFSAAMLRSGINLLWPGEEPMNPGDVCLSHDLSQCYPERDRSSPPNFSSNDYFVLDSWRAVQRSVGSTIVPSLSPDVSRFQSGPLRSALASELSGRTLGTWQDYRLTVGH